MKQLNLIDIYGTLHHEQQITYYCKVHTEYFTKIAHILNQKTTLHMVKIIQVIINEIELELNNRHVSVKPTNIFN